MSPDCDPHTFWNAQVKAGRISRCPPKYIFKARLETLPVALLKEKYCNLEEMAKLSTNATKPKMIKKPQGSTAKQQITKTNLKASIRACMGCCVQWDTCGQRVISVKPGLETTLASAARQIDAQIYMLLTHDIAHLEMHSLRILSIILSFIHPYCWCSSECSTCFPTADIRHLDRSWWELSKLGGDFVHPCFVELSNVLSWNRKLRVITLVISSTVHFILSFYIPTVCGACIRIALQAVQIHL